MSDDVAVVWLDSGEVREDARHALAEWARIREIKLGATPVRPPPIRIDVSIGELVENELEQAHEAIAALDADAAEHALARAATQLREHPELPHAPWLLAEVERTWSDRWLRVEPRNEARARVAGENAHALDGGRVAGVGETTFPPRARVPAILVLPPRAARRATVLLDGNPIESTEIDARGAIYRVEVEPAEHHLLVISGGRILSASWIALLGNDPAPTNVAIDGTSCDDDELSRARRDDHRVQGTGITCPRWIAAVSGDRPNSVFVARCEEDTCGPLIEWRTEPYRTNAAPERRGTPTRWPSWATWTLLGVGAAAATSIALVSSGVFDRHPAPTRFVFGGVRQE